MGVAGFLTNCYDDYSALLKKEYEFLMNKYKLVSLNESEWKFMRMRPNTFPTVRIAQLASLIYSNSRLFSKILHLVDFKEINDIFKVRVSKYWLDHYHFKKKSIFLSKKIGVQLISSIVINTIVPILVLYSEEKKDISFKEKALFFLFDLKSEQNSIVSNFKKIGFKCKNAGQSQALLQLKYKYCDNKKCLSCNIGNQVLKNERIKKFL